MLPSQLLITQQTPMVTLSDLKLKPQSYIGPEYNEKEMLIRNLGYPLPDEFSSTMPDELMKINDWIKNDVKRFTGTVTGLKNRKQKTEQDKAAIDVYKMQKDLLLDYRKDLDNHLRNLEKKRKRHFLL